MKRLKIAASVLVLGLSIAGCSGFLDETPDNRTKIDNVAKVGEVVTLAYPQGAFLEFADIMSDNALDSEKIERADVTNTEYFFWDVPRTEDQDTPTFYWNVSYKAIAQANTAIEAAENIKVELEEKGRTDELKKLSGYEAEALIARAYAHFILVNLWAKTYDPATASSDMGIPYVRRVEKEVLPDYYERNSVQEVYDLIEEDLLAGLENIKNRVPNPKADSSTDKFHFTIESANAFATRFYVYKGEFDKALQYSAGIAMDGSTLRNTQYYSTEYDAESGGKVYADPTEVTNLLVATVPSRKGRNGGYRYNFTQTVANNTLYSQKTNPFGKNWNYLTYGYTASNQLYIPKFDEVFKVEDPTNMTGIPYTTFVLFSNDMLYLDRAEAFINEGDLDQALTMLNVFVRKRTDELSPANKLTHAMVLDWGSEEKSTTQVEPFYVDKLNDTQLSYLRFLADMRRRDTYAEGFRWFDVRRYRMEITHKSTVGSIREEVLSKDDNRKQLQLPEMAIAKGLEANPR